MPNTDRPGEAKPPRKAAMAFILVTLFIDILGIGVIIPVLPELIKEFVGGSTAMAGKDPETGPGEVMPMNSRLRRLAALLLAVALATLVWGQVLALDDPHGPGQLIVKHLFHLGQQDRLIGQLLDQL